MANHFSALKRARQTEKRTARNRNNSSRLRTALRELREALAKGDKAAAERTSGRRFPPWIRRSRRACSTRILPSRYKSRLSARVRAVGAK